MLKIVSDKNGESKITLKPERVSYTATDVSIETLFEKNLLFSKEYLKHLLVTL